MLPLRKLSIAAAVALAASVAAAAAAIAVNGLSDHVAFADAVVVPGNTVYPDGRLSARLQGRLDAAVGAYRAGRCRLIFVSGGTGVEGVDEAQAMQAYLLSEGIPDEVVLRDSAGVDTEATAANAAAALRARGGTTVLAVSQFFHVPRLRLLLEAQGLTVVGSVHARFFEARDAYSLLREVVALGVYFVQPRPA